MPGTFCLPDTCSQKIVVNTSILWEGLRRPERMILVQILHEFKNIYEFVSQIQASGKIKVPWNLFIVPKKFLSCFVIFWQTKHCLGTRFPGSNFSWAWATFSTAKRPGNDDNSGPERQLM